MPNLGGQSKVDVGDARNLGGRSARCIEDV